ncbi:MAG: Gfo/Idh/MocA family protein [Phycisphaerales bacterium JB039]
MNLPTDLQQHWPTPTAARPIVIIGAGGIVRDAHLPAYRQAGLPVAGIFDIEAQRARALAEAWDVPRVLASLDDVVAMGADVVYDVATPPDVLPQIVSALPEGAATLLQKPMGVDLDTATRVLDICRRRHLTAAVNFQLRFTPLALAVRDAVRRGLLGRPIECEAHINVHMPWELWPFLEKLERMEIALHSIHYLDLIRSFLGEPRGVHARTVKHPRAPRLASSRSSIILDYGDEVRCCLSVNHHHAFGRRHQTSEIRLESATGCAIMKLGVNLDYPRGEPDGLEIALDDARWTTVPLAGNWFPDAFAGPMSNLQRFAAGEDAELVTGAADAWRTMALVEACYESDRAGGVPVASQPRGDA